MAVAPSLFAFGIRKELTAKTSWGKNQHQQFCAELHGSKFCPGGMEPEGLWCPVTVEKADHETPHQSLNSTFYTVWGANGYMQEFVDLNPHRSVRVRGNASAWV